MAGFARRLTTCAAGLRPWEDSILAGLRGRLAAIGAGSHPAQSSDAPRVAVVGKPSTEFGAALRAARAAGVTVAPIDARWRSEEDLSERLAEAQVGLTLLAGLEPGSSEEVAAVVASQQLGASAASVERLRGEGLQTAAATAAAGLTSDGRSDEASSAEDAGDGSLLLFSSPRGHLGIPRAAEVCKGALDLRIASAVDQWGFTGEDTVLSLGLRADSSCAVVDALEAPLMAGARVALPGPSTRLGRKRRDAGVHVANETPEDMWASLLQVEDATVVFIASECIQRLLDHHDALAPGLQAQLAVRWQDRPLRSSVAVASPGVVPSQHLSDRWSDMFGCPLQWHFSCPEVGSLFTTGSGSVADLHTGRCAHGLNWQVRDGDLRVSGDAVFDKYVGRPRSTSEAFDDEGFFCQTGHRVSEVQGVGVQPEHHLYVMEDDLAVERYFKREPNVESDGGPTMHGNWRVKKVHIRKYEYWRTVWGGVLPTKKHNQAHKVYKGRYK